MTTLFKNFPLGARLMLIFGLLLFNYAFFPFVTSLFILPFYDIEHIKGIMSGNFAAETDKYIFLTVQGVGSLGAFAFTSLLVAQMETRFVMKRLGLTIKPSFKVVAVTIFAILVAQVLIQFLVQINELIPIPAALKFLEEQGKEAEKITDAILKGNSVLLLLVNVVVLAVIPAIGEEFFFRGLVLGDLLKSKVNPAVAIISTGLLFSISHMEFNNLLAIWVLGSFLGYLYYSSGSLWLSIAAHFTNNFLLVVFKYLYNSGYIKSDVADANFPLYSAFISVALFAGCFYILAKWRKRIDFTVQLSAPDLTEEEGYEHGHDTFL